MPIEFLCPQCQALLQTPDDSAGMQATCPQCNLTMLVPAPAPAVAPAPQPDAGPAPLPHSAETPAAPAPAASTSSKTPAAPPPSSASIPQFQPPEPFEPLQPVRPTPRRFTVYSALAYGWEVMKGNFNAFFLAAIVFASLGGCLPLLPLLLAGMGALAVRAARGSQPEVGVVFSGMNDLPRVVTMMTLWVGLTATLHLPLAALWFMMLTTKFPVAQLLGGLMFFVGGMLYGVRLGWVPFAVIDRPHLSFSQLVEHSLAISRGKTLDLVFLAALTYFTLLATVWGFFVGFVFFGIPIALGVGGATYVLLVRDSGK